MTNRNPFTDHPITGSPDQPILTALQSFILTTIHQRGPQSDMGLWSQARGGESLTVIFIATATLSDDNFIERAPADKIPQRYPAGTEHYWQLTQKGQEHFAALGAAAACNAAQP